MLIFLVTSLIFISIGCGIFYNSHRKDRLARSKLEALFAFIPRFEKGEFDNAKSDFEKHYYIDASRELIDTLAESGVYLGNDFDWVGWIKDNPITENPEIIKSASVEDIRQILTAMINQDRFIDGMLAEKFESGMMENILQRLEELDKNSQIKF